VNFQDFEPEKNGLRLKANITSSTRATVIAPPCPEGFNQSVIEISLNDQQYSDNNVIYRYYRRPTLYYITPREGPIKGGTVVTAVGQNFRDTKEITCKFGDQKVPGVFKSQREIECIAPQTDKPMSVPFSISLSMDMYSPSVPYLYYDEPQVLGIGPSCGPDYGLTQISVGFFAAQVLIMVILVVKKK